MTEITFYAGKEGFPLSVTGVWNSIDEELHLHGKTGTGLIMGWESTKETPEQIAIRMSKMFNTIVAVFNTSRGPIDSYLEPLYLAFRGNIYYRKDVDDE